MDRLLRALGVTATLALVGYAAWLLLADPEADEVIEDAIAVAERGEDERVRAEQVRDRRLRLARSLAPSPDGPAESTPPSEAPAPVSSVPYGSGEIDLETARTGFDYAMDEVETVVAARRRISVDDWERLYRQANDAFSALSIGLDSSDEAQRAELDEAHVRLKNGLRKVKVRGKKFGF